MRTPLPMRVTSSFAVLIGMTTLLLHPATSGEGGCRAMLGQQNGDPLLHGLVHFQYDCQVLEPGSAGHLRLTLLPDTGPELLDHRHEPVVIISKLPEALSAAVSELEPGRSQLEGDAPQ